MGWLIRVISESHYSRLMVDISRVFPSLAAEESPSMPVMVMHALTHEFMYVFTPKGVS